MNTLPLSQFIFPDPIEADPDGHGLICIGADLSPSTLFEAYTHGLFPWFNEDELYLLVESRTPLRDLPSKLQA